MNTLKGGRRVAGAPRRALRQAELDFIPPSCAKMPADRSSRDPPSASWSNAPTSARLQMHTTASDAENSIEEMAAAARALGYDYIALTDHAKPSPSQMASTKSARARRSAKFTRPTPHARYPYPRRQRRGHPQRRRLDLDDECSRNSMWSSSPCIVYDSGGAEMTDLCSPPSKIPNANSRPPHRPLCSPRCLCL